MGTPQKFGITNLKLVLHPVFTAISTVANLDTDHDGKVSKQEGLVGAYTTVLTLAPAFPQFDEAGQEIEDLDAEEFDEILAWAEDDFQIEGRTIVTDIVKRTLNAIRYNKNYVSFMADAVKSLKASKG